MDNLTPITREEMLMNDETLTPITREEKILAGEDLNPVTRREYFLKKYRHAGGEVMVEGLEVTANGTYTAPEGKAYSPVEVAVPLPDNAYLLKEASGSLVSFNDGADLPMPSFICNIDAVQDLHGQDAPWVGGAGKNKYHTTVTGRTNNGVTYTTNESSITASNTATATSYAFNNANWTYSNSILLKAGTYTISMNQITGSAFGVVKVSENGGAESYIVEYTNNDSATFTLSEDTYIAVNLRINNGTTVNTTFNIQIEEGATATTFAPYSNICPISGHTEVNAWVRGKNLYPMLIGNDAFTSNNDGSYSTGANGELIVECSDRRYSGVYTHPQSEFFKLLNTILVLPCNVSFDIVANKSTNVSLGTGGLVAVDTTKKRVTIPFNTSVAFVVYSWSEAVTVTISNFMVSKSSDPTYEPYNPQSQTIQVSWQTEAGEVFGGYVDLVSGVLTVTHRIVNCKNLTFSQGTNAGGLHWATITDSATNIEPISNKLKYLSWGDDGWLSTSPCLSVQSSTKIARVYGNLSDFADGGSYENTMVVYELKTPQTYQLTPTQIKSLKDDITNAWCSTGDVDIDYFAKEVEG